MNYYASLNEMWNDALDSIEWKGSLLNSRDGVCKEIIGWSGMLTTIHHNFLINKIRKADPSYAAAEILWYLSGSRSIKMIEAYAPQYKRFAEHGIAHGAYGWRMGSDPLVLESCEKAKLPRQGQIKLIVDLLKRKPDSRQAIVSLWNCSDLPYAITGTKKDLPCTLSLQFLLRQNTLHLIVTMRSNDVWLGMPYDVFAFTTLQIMVANAIKAIPGTYIHQVGSLHLYARNYYKAKEAREAAENGRAHNHNWFAYSDVAKATKEILTYEAQGRLLPGTIPSVLEHFENNPLYGTLYLDLLGCCLKKWHKQIHIHSDILRCAYDYR